MSLEVRVERAKCIGSNSCTRAAPGVFRLDAEGIAVVVDVEAEPEDTVIDAAEACPTSAIAVVKDGRRIV